MSKSAEMSKVLAVVVLILLIAGMGVCFLPLPKQVPIVQWLSTRAEQGQSATPFGEQAELTRRYEQETAQKITEALGKVVGSDKVQVSVQAQLEFSDETLKEIKETRTGETELKVHHVSGHVKNISVTVVMDGVMTNSRRGKSVYQPRSLKEMKQYEEIVKSVIGFNAERGDRVVVQNMPFIDESVMILGRPLSAIGSWIITGLWCVLLAGIIGGILLPYLKKITGDAKCVRQPESVLKKAIALCYQNPERAAGVLKRWIENGSKRPDPRHYSPVEQAGIVVLSIGDQVSRMLVGSLSESDMRQIGQKIACLGRVSAADIRESLSRFVAEYQMPAAVFGTERRLKELLKNTVADSHGLYCEISIDTMGKTVWEMLEKTDVGRLVGWLERKKPETVAIILYHLSPELSGKIISLLPPETGTRALIHLSHLKQVRAEVADKMTREVAPEVIALLSENKEVCGADKTASILKTLSDKDKEKWISSVSQENQAVGADLSARLKEWNDVMTLSPDSMKQLLGYTDVNVLARALSVMPEAKRAVFIPYIPADIYESMSRKFTALASHPQEAAQAQNLIVKTAQKLKLF